MFWDGGINTDSSLKEKVKFYSISERMSCIIKDIIIGLGEKAFVGKELCENKKLFAEWSDLEKYELFQEISELLKPKQYYEISLPQDEGIIDLIVESNFRYFTHIAMYLPETKLIVLPTCHTELLIYSFCPDKIVGFLDEIITKYSSDKYKIVLCNYKNQ